MGKPDLGELRRMAERSRYLTVDAYGPVPVRGDELLVLVDEVEYAREFRRLVIEAVLDKTSIDMSDLATIDRVLK